MKTLEQLKQLPRIEAINYINSYLNMDFSLNTSLKLSDLRVYCKALGIKAKRSKLETLIELRKHMNFLLEEVEDHFKPLEFKITYVSARDALEMLGMDAGYNNIIYGLVEKRYYARLVYKINGEYKRRHTPDSEPYIRIVHRRRDRLSRMLDDAYDVIFSKGWC